MQQTQVQKQKGSSSVPHLSELCTWVLVSDWKDATEELLGAWAAAGYCWARPGRVAGRGSGWGACIVHATCGSDYAPLPSLLGESSVS